MTETTNQTAKYSKNYSGDVGETPKPMTGTWHLEAPDGRRWAGSCPINCVAQELAERVPVQVQLARMLAVVAEPDLDERHAKLGVEYGTGKVDDLVDKLHAEITELRAKLDALEKQGPTSITGAQALDALDELDASARGDEPYNHFATPLIRRYIEFTLAAGARPVEPAPADDVLEALALSPDQFRTESGFINQGKLRAAIRYPEKYLQPEHWMRAQPAPAEQADAKDAARYRWLTDTLGDQPHGTPTLMAAWDDDIGFWRDGSFFGLKDKASIDAAIDSAMAVDKKGQS